ncbi:MAG: hypothetical protein U1E51_21750 [Candidatus Binatia bacterium]|nr:hypothetical protein [Candidatus Binatia bacterium]
MKKSKRQQRISEEEVGAEDLALEHVYGNCGSCEAETERLMRARQRVRQRHKNLAKKK